MGYLINKIYHLELFQSIIIVSIVGVGLILLWIKFSVEKIEQNLIEQNDCWDDDDDDNEDDDVICPECGERMAKTEIPIPKENHATIGRNAPCPCGSGKKYKNCCGKI